MKGFILLLFVVIIALAVHGQVCQQGEQRSCGVSDVGECRLGTQVCKDGQWGLCLGAVGPTDEVCHDGKDNNCDGKIDENCECTSGEERSCGVSSVGMCTYGKQICVHNQWEDCQGNVDPLPAELCGDSVDNNCNGQVDEGCVKESCQDHLKNQGEEDVDCGGPCAACPSCTDGILNQGEEKVKVNFGNGKISDCGGSKCPACPSCFDGVKNQNEEQVDCGGVCGPCQIIKEVSSCGNGMCEQEKGETSSNCSLDCKTSSSSFLLVGFIFLLLFIGIGSYIYFKFFRAVKEKKGEEKVKPLFDVTRFQTLQKKEKGKDRVEQQLSKSFEELGKTLKK